MRLILAAAAFALAPVAAFAQSDVSDDELAVREAVHGYFWGRQNGDQERLAAAFDQEYGDMKYVADGDDGEIVQIVSLRDFAARLNRPIPNDSHGRILSMDIVDGKMAWVKFLIDTENTDFVDYLMLYKRNGEWRIVNKMFVRR
ncbi:MAG: hypothetical protein Tsb0010_19120 [Parvularculaceae bacterium]